MKTHRYESLRRRKLSPKQLEENDRWVARELLELDLRQLREALGKTQEEVATLAEMSQSELSKVERREDHRVSTLRRIARALGGELEIVITVGGKRIRLSQA